MLKIFVEIGSLIAEIKSLYAELMISEGKVPLLVEASADGPPDPPVWTSALCTEG